MPVLAHPVTITLPPVEPVTDGKPNPERVYHVAGSGPGVRVQYVRILKDRAWEELNEQADRMPISRYNRLELGIFREMGAGKYEWGGEVHQSLDGTPDGLKVELLARLRVGSNQPDLHRSVIDELLDRYTLETLARLMTRADGPALPNGQTPPASPASGDTSTTKN